MTKKLLFLLAILAIIWLSVSAPHAGQGYSTGAALTSEAIAAALGFTPADETEVVPYTGATESVDLGTKNLTANSASISSVARFASGFYCGASTNVANGIMLHWPVAGGLIFEGSTADTNETALLADDPTSDNSLYVPDLSGKVWAGQATIPSESLTDGAPTDAELDSAFTSPATVGQGGMRLVIDSDGGGGVYVVVSDGTNWHYQQITQAS